MKISIIIPNFNGALLLKENLPHVYGALEAFEKTTGEKGEIIVTDDASTDDSHTVIKTLSLPVRFLTHQKNAGFSTNVNRGVKEANGEIVVLLNTDVTPDKDFLSPLVAHFQNEEVFAVGCMDRSIEKGKEVLRGRGIGQWTRGFLVHSAGDLSGVTTLWASGGSSAFCRSLWEKLGGMDEVFNPFYWEDIDLSYRAWKAGYTILFEKKSVVTHEHEKGSIRSFHNSSAITKRAYRNQFLFVWKNASGNLLMKHICWLPYHLIRAILRGDGAFWAGLIAALPYWNTMRKQRSALQKLQKRTDEEVIQLTNT